MFYLKKSNVTSKSSYANIVKINTCLKELCILYIFPANIVKNWESFRVSIHMFNRKQSPSARKIDPFNVNIGKIQTDTCQQTHRSTLAISRQNMT